ncbi:MAG: hypothetical protein AAGA54_08360 [Myxococcota bacterium]
MNKLQLRSILGRFAIAAVLPLSLAACDDAGGTSTSDGSSDTESDDDDDGSESDTAVTVTVTDTTPTTATATMTDTATETATEGTTVTDTDSGADSGSTTGGEDSGSTSTGGEESGSTSTGEVETTGTSECQQLMIDGPLAAADLGGAIGYTGTMFSAVGEKEEDLFRIEFYPDMEGAYTEAGAVIDLSMAPSDNYGSCLNCIRLLEDISPDGSSLARQYFQSEGTLTASTNVDGLDSEFTLSGVRLIEVTIDGGTFESTPVKDGGCVDIVDVTTTAILAPPAGWTCSVGSYNDGMTCDCGCGVVDPDCADETAASCESCNGEGSCDAEGMDCSIIDADDNAVCDLTLLGWNCNPAFYDADDGCDCGCGAPDPDCGGDMTLAICEFCDNLGSCSDQECDGNTQLDPADNSVCVEP